MAAATGEQTGRGTIPAAVLVLACAYLALMPIGLSPFPWNIQWADLLFVPLAVAVLRLGPIGFGWFEWLVVAYLAASAASLTVSADRVAAAVALAKQADVAAVYFVFAALARRDGANTFARVLALTVVAMASLGLMFAVVYAVHPIDWAWLGSPMHLPYVGTVLRLTVTTSSPEMFGNVLTFATPLAIAVWGSPPVGRRLFALALALLAVAALLTFSHAIAGILVSVTAVCWARRPLASHVAGRALVGLGVVAAVLVVNILLVAGIRDVRMARTRDTTVPPPTYMHAFQSSEGAEILLVSVVYNPMSYWNLKKIAVAAFIDRPWTGHGLASFHSLAARAVARGQIQPAYGAADPHSTWAGRLAETGVAGGVTLATLWLGALFAWRPADASRGAMLHRALWAALLGLAVNSMNVDVMNFRFLWIGFALLRGRLDITPGPLRDVSSPRKTMTCQD